MLQHINPLWSDEFKFFNYEDLNKRELNSPRRSDIVKWEEFLVPQNWGLVYLDKNPYPEWTKKIADLIGLSNARLCFFKMTPLTVVPYHSDLYKKYIELNNIQPEDYNRIHRAVMFLEDWKPGHYLELDSKPVVNWRAGDYVMWHYDTPHLAANMGNEDRYTFQITGLK